MFVLLYTCALTLVEVLSDLTNGMVHTSDGSFRHIDEMWDDHLEYLSGSNLEPDEEEEEEEEHDPCDVTPRDLHDVLHTNAPREGCYWCADYT